MNASYHVEKSGFSGTVRADQSGDATFADFKAGTVDSVKTAEMFVQVVNDDHFASPSWHQFRRSRYGNSPDFSGLLGRVDSAD
jgi:hypothetical protein